MLSMVTLRGSWFRCAWDMAWIVAWLVRRDRRSCVCEGGAGRGKAAAKRRWAQEQTNAAPLASSAFGLGRTPKPGSALGAEDPDLKG